MLEDSIEILTTDDERLKVIGEEISNETGRAVLSKLFEGVTSISAISSSLDVSMQLVRFDGTISLHLPVVASGIMFGSNTRTVIAHRQPHFYQAWFVVLLFRNLP
ncbi:MAG: hypothetical protein KGL95_13235 [Patescibacteria group bacterium]|nr:hypothetical protein [Patescibacteria group bacterium]